MDFNCLSGDHNLDRDITTVLEIRSEMKVLKLDFKMFILHKWCFLQMFYLDWAFFRLYKLYNVLINLFLLGALHIYLCRKSNPGLFYFLYAILVFFNSKLLQSMNFIFLLCILLLDTEIFCLLTTVCSWFRGSCSLVLLPSQLPHFANQKISCQLSLISIWNTFKKWLVIHTNL